MNKILGLDFNNLFAGFYPPSFAQIIMMLLGAYLIYMSIYYNSVPQQVTESMELPLFW